jgi:hypothetical protein
MAVNFYCDENDGSFPPVESWPDALDRYNLDERSLTSPLDRNAGRAWAMNKHLDGLKKHEIKHPHRTVLIFEALLDSPPAGGRELLPERPRGQRGYVIGFLNGRAKCVRPERLDQLIWIPQIKESEVVK